jgi:hypothetical protein
MQDEGGLFENKWIGDLAEISELWRMQSAFAFKLKAYFARRSP